MTYSQHKKTKSVALRLVNILLIWTLVMSYVYSITYADNSTNPYSTEMETIGADEENNDYALDSDTSESILKQMFGTSVWEGTNISAGVSMAKPFVVLIMTFCIALVVIVCFAFFFVTALDIAFITVPILRPLLVKGKEKMSDNTAGKFCCISDSALEAVGMKGGGSMAGSMGGGDRGVGSCLTKYIGSRTGEFIAFVLFVIFFFTGILGSIVVVLFNLLYSLLEGVLNLA